jgi:hypothetical protein
MIERGLALGAFEPLDALGKDHLRPELLAFAKEVLAGLRMIEVGWEQHSYGPRNRLG